MKCPVRFAKSRVLSKGGTSDVDGQRGLSRSKSWPLVAQSALSLESLAKRQ